MRHHLDDGRDPAPLLADGPGVRAGELDLGGGVRAVAELVLQALEMQTIHAAVGQEARQQETGEPARRLRQHQEGVRHGRGHEPLVAGDDVFGARAAFAHGLRPGGRRAHVGATLLLGHAHAESDGALLRGRRKARVVLERQDARHPLLGECGLEQQHRHGGVGHGNRAAVPSLHLRRHVEGTRTAHVRTRPWSLPGLCEVGPDRAVQALAAACAHQLVVGRVICDRVAAMAARVVGRKPRGMLIGKPAAPERLCAARQAPEGLQPLRRVAPALPLDSLLEGRVGGKEVHVLQWWRLVEDLMRCKRGRHASPFNAFWQT